MVGFITGRTGDISSRQVSFDIVGVKKKKVIWGSHRKETVGIMLTYSIGQLFVVTLDEL